LQIRAIYQAMVEGDAKAAGNACREHVKAAAQIAKEVLGQTLNTEITT